MSGQGIYLGYVRSNLHNGVGRMVCQLQRVTIKFCKTSFSSARVRDFIQQDLVNFARSNPGIVVYLKPRRHRTPVMVAEYLNGGRNWMSLCKLQHLDIIRWLEHMKNQSGYPIVHFLKKNHTDNPTVQGIWTPFTHIPTDVNITSFPDHSWSNAAEHEDSATKTIMEMLKNQQLTLNTSDIPTNIVAVKDKE